MDFHPLGCYIEYEDSKMPRRQSATAAAIREMARQHHVHYVGTQSDVFAHHMTRLAGDTVILDDVEQTLLALQRAGHLSRRDLVRLQASYLREAGL
jgi:hypothetical protein